MEQPSPPTLHDFINLLQDLYYFVPTLTHVEAKSLWPKCLILFSTFIQQKTIDLDLFGEIADLIEQRKQLPPQPMPFD
jgi:hypothetical protein